MASKQWTAQDIDKIWNSVDNGAQAKTAPLPSLNNTSKKANTSNTYKFKPYEDKEYTAKDIAKIWKNVERSKEVQSEMKNKANNTTPAMYSKVPTKERLDELNKADTRNMSREEEVAYKKKAREEKKTRKEETKKRNNITRSMGDTNANRYDSRFMPGVKDSFDNSELGQKSKALAQVAYTNQQNNLMEQKAYKNQLAQQQAAADELSKDILDNQTLAAYDAQLKMYQSMPSLDIQDQREIDEINERLRMHEEAKKKLATLNGEHHVVDNTRYNKLMSNNRLARDIDALADVVYNNADQDATVSPEWAETYGAKAITGGLTKDQYIDQLSKRYELTKDELLDMALSRKAEKQNEEYARDREMYSEFGAKYPRPAWTGARLASIGAGGEGLVNTALVGLTGDDRYASRMFDTVKGGLDEGAKSTVDTNAGRIAYDLSAGVGDMLTASLFGDAPFWLAGNAMNRTMLNSLDSGIDPRQAALYSGLTGATDYITNRIGLDKAKELAMGSVTDAMLEGLSNSETRNQVIKEVAKAGLKNSAIAGMGEAGENVIQDVAQTFIDRLVNGQDAELNRSYNEKIAQGMSPEEALKETAKEYAANIGVDALQGYAMGAAMQGAHSLPNAANILETDLFMRDLEKNGQRLQTEREINRAQQVRMEAENVTEPTVTKTQMLEDSSFAPDYKGVPVEYGDDYAEPETLDHVLTGKKVSPEYASLIRKLESGQVENIADLQDEYNAIPEIQEAMQRAGTGSTSDIKTPERETKRAEILNDINNFGSAEEYYDPVDKKTKVRYTGNVEKGHRADIIIGLPSSGKSSAVVDPISNKYHSKLLDSDEVKKLIPEFDDGWGAGLVHEESKAILEHAKATAYKNGENVVLPIVGSNPDKVRREIQRLKDVYGYEVHLHLNDLDSSKAAARNLRRFASQGRFLDLNTTSFDYGDKPRDVYEQLKKEGVADGYNKVSNDVRFGENPVQLEGTEVIPFDWRNNGQSGRNSGKDSGGRGGEIPKGEKPTDNTVTNVTTEQATSEPASSMSELPQIDKTTQAEAPQSTVNTDDFLVKKILVNGQERYRIMKDLPENSDLVPASEFGKKVFKSEKSARAAIKKLAAQANASASEGTPAKASNAESLLAQRSELVDELNQEGLKINDMAEIQKQIKALDSELKKVRPDLFEDGKYVGENKPKRINSLEDKEVETEDNAANEDVTNEDVTNEEQNTSEETPKNEEEVSDEARNELNFNLQFFAEASKEKEELKVRLSEKGLKLAEKRRINERINDIDEAMKGLRKTIVNTAVKAGIISADDIENDPELKKISEYIRHSNEVISEKARQNLEQNAEQIKKDYVSGRRHIDTDLDADQAMQLLKGEHGDLDNYERNSILRNLAINGTQAGQFIQALAKYSNTKEAAFISATKVIDDETQYWKSRHEREVGRNGRLAEALKRQGYDGTIDLEKPKPTFEELVEQVRNTLSDEYASIEDQFSESDIHYLAHMLEHNASIDELVDALNTKMATGRFGISDETQAKVNELFEEAMKYDENSQEYVENQAEAFRLLAAEITPKATPLEKFDAWRYMAMLGNPKTMLRNFIGNKIFGAITGASNNLAAIIESGTDKGLKKFTGKGIQRTKAILNPIKDKELLEATLADAYGKRFRQMEGSKYEKMDKDALRQHRSTFDSKLMQLAEKAVDRGISDTKAVAKKYSTSMAGYMKANGITLEDLNDAYMFDMLNRSKSLLSKAERAEMESLRETANKVEKAREYAFKQAEYATFHEDNAIADILSRASRKNMAGRAIVEGLVPFKKTPANIIRSGVEFSPLGAIKSIAKTGKLIYENTGSRKENLSDTYKVRNPLNHAYKEVNRTLAADVIESWSQTFTGSTLAALGYYLTSKGILHSSTADEKYQDELEGKQNYSIEINGKTYTIDWAVPGAMPLLLGAEVKKAFDESAELDEKWYENSDRFFNTLNGMFEPIVETSMLQGVENTLNELTNKYDDSTPLEKVLNAGTLVGTNYLTQAIPTLSGQIARTVDNTRRSTDTKSEGLFKKTLEKQGRKVMNKIPGLSKFNQPYVNARGEEQKNSPYKGVGNLIYQTLSPWYAQEIDERDSDRIAREAYHGRDSENRPIMDSGVFAKWRSPFKLNGKRLNPEQMHDYRKASGKANTKIREALADEDWFNELPATQQTEILKNTNTLVDHIGKAAVDADYQSDSDMYNTYLDGGVDAVLEEYRKSSFKSQYGVKYNEAAEKIIDRDGANLLNEMSKYSTQEDWLPILKSKNFSTAKTADYIRAMKGDSIAQSAGTTDQEIVDYYMGKAESSEEKNTASAKDDNYSYITQAGGSKKTYNSFQLYSSKQKTSKTLPQLDAKSYMTKVSQIEKYNKDGSQNHEVSQQELVDYMRAQNNGKGYDVSTADDYVKAFFGNEYEAYTVSRGDNKGKVGLRKKK